MNSDQPVIDRSRRSLSVPKHLMPSLLAAHAGKLPRSDATTQLRAAGMIEARRLDPLVQQLIDVIMSPRLVITAETDRGGPDTQGLATIWAEGNHAVVGGRSGNGSFDLIAVERSLLVFHLAQTVRLVPRPNPIFKGSFQVPAAVLAKAESVAAADPVRAEQILRAAHIDALWIDRILATLIMRRSLWTVESIWIGDNRRREEARLTVLDGGFGGYWRLRQIGHVVTVSSIGFDDLLSALAGLLPGTTIK